MLDPDRDYTDSDLENQELFALGDPVLVCRWRLSGRRLPMANRHLRALGWRVVDGAPLTPEFLAWVRQHMEQTLDSGTADVPDGVLMLLVDGEGRAAMAAGPYEPLADATVAALLDRAKTAGTEAASTAVAPETVWAASDGALTAGFASPDACGGAGTLVLDLAKTLGIPVAFDPDLAARLGEGAAFDEVFLVSDEHGVVAASDCTGPLGERLAAGYGRLLEATADGRR